MKKFNRVIRGYNPDEVNVFVEEVIAQVEGMLKELESKNNEISSLQERLQHYQAMETTLNRAILAAEETSDKIKKVARQESSMIVEDAKKNASRIVNEALIKAEKTEYESALLQKNVSLFKRRLRSIIETQLAMVDDMDQIEL